MHDALSNLPQPLLGQAIYLPINSVRVELLRQTATLTRANAVAASRTLINQISIRLTILTAGMLFGYK
jgi:hypothetical protein